MNINRDMRSCYLQVNRPRESSFGADEENWEIVNTINVAIYKKNEVVNVSNEKYKETTHIAFTHERDISSGNMRLKIGNQLFAVEDCIHQGGRRLAQLLLKEVGNVSK